MDAMERIGKMPIEQEIDSLIEAGWIILNSDFSEIAIQKWRIQALKCLMLLCEPNHPYPEYFRNQISEANTGNALVGVGVLEAAKASMALRIQVTAECFPSSQRNAQVSEIEEVSGLSRFGSQGRIDNCEIFGVSR